MAVGAVGLVPVGVVLSHGVLGVADYFEVVGVDAETLAAQVVELHSFRNGLESGVFPQDAVCDSFSLSGESVLSVSVGGLWSGPEPASVWLDGDLPHEGGVLASVECVGGEGHGFLLGCARVWAW